MRSLHTQIPTRLILPALAIAMTLHSGRPGRVIARGGITLGNITAVQANSNSAASMPDPKSTARVKEAYGKLPMSFEANEGQTDPKVKFLSRGVGYSLFLTPTEAVLALTKSSTRESQHKIPTPLERKVSKQPSKQSQAVLRMRLLGANPTPQIEGMNELGNRSNYLLGNDPKNWRTSITNYAKVQYRNVYPGIDLVYYGNQQQLEYDFVLAPGADPRVIKLSFTGAQQIRIEENGTLVLRLAGGEVRQRKSLIYQNLPDGTRQAITGRYVLKKHNQVSYEVGKYHRGKPLVIDPVLVYSTFMGAGGNSSGTGIAVDSGGNAYVTGNTASRDFPITPGALQAAQGGGDIFITKVDASGSALLYSTYLGGVDSDSAVDIAVDSAGNAYVTGETSSLNFPTTTGALQRPHGGGSIDAFVTKLTATGSSLMYSTLLGGSGSESSYGIAVDALGNAYVTGWTNSRDFPITSNALQRVLGGNGDAFLVKVNLDGSSLLYSTFLGGSSDDYGSSIAVDAAGNACVTGYTGSRDFPTTPGALQRTFIASFRQAFVAKVNSVDSSLIYSTLLGGSGSADLGYGIAVDTAGNAYVTGYTDSSDFPITPNAYQKTILGSGAFVTKLNATGSGLVYSTYLGGSSLNYGRNIALDAFGNAYVAGATSSPDFPVTAGAFQTVYRGAGDAKFFQEADAFVAKLNPSGSGLLYSTFLGGSSSDTVYDLTLDASGNVYLTGETYSRDFPVSPGSFQSTRSSGGIDAFVVKLNSAGNALSYSTFLGGSGSISISDIALDVLGNTYVTGGTSSLNFPITPGAFQSAYNGYGDYPFNTGGDVFVAKLNKSGNGLLYSTFLGGSNGDSGSSIAVDAAGNAYVTGRTYSRDFPTTPGAFQSAHSNVSESNEDAFVAKLNTTGSGLLYSTFLGGKSTDYGSDITVDQAGNAYVTGLASSDDFPITPGAFQAVRGSGFAFFVTKLNGSGSSLIYSTFLGSLFFSASPNIAVDVVGNAYVTGVTDSPSFPTTPEAFQKTRGGSDDSFVAKLNAAGSSLLYSTFLGGGGNDFSQGIAVDAAGNAYVVGFTDSADFPITPGAFQVTRGGGRDVFVAKLNAAGSTLIYSTFLGGIDLDTGSDIKVDAAGQAFITGYTYSANFPITPRGFQLILGGASDAFVAVLSAGGNRLLYSTFLGGKGFDSGNSIAVDVAGNAYVVGSSSSVDFPTTPGAFKSDGAGGFIAKIAQNLAISLAPPAQTLKVGEGSAFTVTIATLQASDTLVIISSSDSSVISVPASITIPAGQLSVSFNGVGLAAGKTVTITVTVPASLGGDSTNASVTIVKAATSATISSSINPSAFNQPVTLTTNINVTPPGAGVPTGAVTFSDGAVILGTGPLNTEGQATLTTSALSVGTHSITAAYGGDNNFTGSSSPILLQAVNGADLTISQTAEPDLALVGSAISYTINVTNSGPGPATSVTITDNLPASLTFVSCAATGGGVCGGSGNNRTVTFASLAQGASATITLVATVSNSLVEGDVISNTVTVDSATPDVNPENNTATAAVKVRGVPLARLTLEGNKPQLEFGPIAATHEPLADPPARSFTVESIGSAPLVITFASLSRMGPDVGGQKITNQDDRSLFQISTADPNGGETPTAYNTQITIAPKSQQRFRVVFNPLLPILAGSNTMISANQVLPESMTAQVTITQNGGEAMTVNLLGHVSTVAKLIDPTDPRRAPFIKLDRAGGELTVECSVFDPNLDLSRVVYQFLSANDSKVGAPVEVDVVDAIKDANLVKGQAFKVVQSFEGGSSISQISKVQVTIYDRESNPAAADGPVTGVLGATEPALATVSAASYQASTLPGDSIVAGFGAGLAAGTQAATTSPLPTELAGTRVKIRDGAGVERLAPLFFVSPGQVNYQIPADSSPGAATVTIVRASGATATGVVHIADTGPGLFAANSNGQGVAAAVVLRVRPDGTPLYEPVSRFDEARRQFVTIPINLESATDQVYLILFGTGIRRRASLGDVKIAVGGTGVPVLYAGAQGSFAGLDQLNVALPRSLSGRGEVDVELTVAGHAANAVRVNVGGNASFAAFVPPFQTFSEDLRSRSSDMEFRPAAVIVLPPVRLTTLPVNKPE